MGYVTLDERKAAKVSRMDAAVGELKPLLAAYAREHGGRFILFGSAARREMRFDSDVDILVDFPIAQETTAVVFAEDECRRLGLKGDVLGLHWTGERFRRRVEQEGLFLPGDEARWAGASSREDRLSDIRDAARAAAEHFRAAARLFAEIGSEPDEETAYRNHMAVLHAMLRGHTALEDCLVRALKARGGETIEGSDWHRRVIEVASRAGPAHAAILSADLTSAANETRKFRHFAARAYSVAFDTSRARQAVESGQIIARRIEGVIEEFGKTIELD